MRLDEFASAEAQLALLKLIMANTLKSLDDQRRAEVAQALRRKAAYSGRIPTKRAQPPKPKLPVATPPKPPPTQNIEPETKNIEVLPRPQPAAVNGLSDIGSPT